MTAGFARGRGLFPRIACILTLALASTGAHAASSTAQNEVRQGCEALAGVLGSVKMDDCMHAGLLPSGGHTVDGRPILLREYPALSPRRPQARILLIGGIHGDEYSAFSIIFRWMHTLKNNHSGLFEWRIVPGVNLDGLNADPATRTNAHGIDLNRNFPTPDWQKNKQEYWVKFTGSDPRRYPGETPLSEPETQWLYHEIQTFKPDAIVSVHAPFGVLDFDGPNTPPHHLGYLYLNRLGTYPGSLGNYAGVHAGVPVITMELPHAGIMPTEKQSSQVWFDLVYWLKHHIKSADSKANYVVHNNSPEPPLRTAGYSPAGASCNICQPATGSRSQNCCLRATAWKLLLE